MVLVVGVVFMKFNLPKLKKDPDEGMMCVTLHAGQHEYLRIGDDVKIFVSENRGTQIRILVVAKKSIRILREKLP